jgi:hypothetical protein
MNVEELGMLSVILTSADTKGRLKGRHPSMVERYEFMYRVTLV